MSDSTPIQTNIINNPYDLPGQRLNILARIADEARQKYHIEKVECCAIVNAKSGCCSENCSYCAQSAHHKTAISTFPLLSQNDILKAALCEEANGATRFSIVTSGTKLSKEELDLVCKTISFLKSNTKMEICASLGMLNFDELLSLKQAGVSRYHHNLETSRNHTPHIVTTRTYEDRLNTNRLAKKAGLTICVGGIFGLGETWADRISMALDIRDLEPEGVPLNFLIPVKGTPLENAPPLSVAEILKIIAIYRILIPNASIKVIAGREQYLGDAQLSAFLTGADGMMVGGYLTTGGRNGELDKILKNNIEEVWRGY